MSTSIKIIDTHFHIWDLDHRKSIRTSKSDGSFDWPDASLVKIFRNFSASEVAGELNKSNVDAAVFVQCLNNCPEEIRWVEDLAKEHPVIKGIVGGVDLTQVMMILIKYKVAYLKDKCRIEIHWLHSSKSTNF